MTAMSGKTGIPACAGIVPFIKMNGAGNDFVVLDARTHPITLTPEQIRQIARRDNAATQGCDQVIVIEDGMEGADAFMHIYNADGGRVEACGNATRCVAWLLMREGGEDAVSIRTRAGVLACGRAGEGQVTVDMGPPRFDPQDIPVAGDIDIDHVPLEYGALKDGMAVGMGNPHMVFFVEDAAAVDLAALGPLIEHRTDIFPERVNVSVAQVLCSPLGGEQASRARSAKASRGGAEAEGVTPHASASAFGLASSASPHVSDEAPPGTTATSLHSGAKAEGGSGIMLRTWERGAGLTKACGTAACAALVAAHRRGLTGRAADIEMPGGVLRVEWRADGHVWMTGPVAWEFEGTLML